MRPKSRTVRALHRWLDMAAERTHVQGLPAWIGWVGLGDRHRSGLAFDDMVANCEGCARAQGLNLPSLGAGA